MGQQALEDGAVKQALHAPATGACNTIDPSRITTASTRLAHGEWEHALEDGAVKQALHAPATGACATTALKSRGHPAASARGRGWAATAHVLAAPRKLAHGPLLDQAVVAPMVPSIAVIRQRGRRRGRRWWRSRWAALALSPAAEGLLACGPAPH